MESPSRPRDTLSSALRSTNVRDLLRNLRKVASNWAKKPAETPLEIQKPSRRAIRALRGRFGRKHQPKKPVSEAPNENPFPLLGAYDDDEEEHPFPLLGAYDDDEEEYPFPLLGAYDDEEHPFPLLGAYDNDEEEHPFPLLGAIDDFKDYDDGNMSPPQNNGGPVHQPQEVIDLTSDDSSDEADDYPLGLQEHQVRRGRPDAGIYPRDQPVVHMGDGNPDFGLAEPPRNHPAIPENQYARPGDIWGDYDLDEAFDDAGLAEEFVFEQELPFQHRPASRPTPATPAPRVAPPISEDIPEEILETKIQCVDTILNVFPDICRDYVSDLYDTVSKSSQRLIADILDKMDKGSSYPNAKEKQRDLKRKREVDVDAEAARKYGAPDRVMSTAVGGIRTYIAKILSAEFSLTSMSYINATLSQTGYRLFSAYEALEEAERTWTRENSPYPRLKTSRKSRDYTEKAVAEFLASPDVNGHIDHEKVEVLEELQAARRIRYKADARRAAERAVEIEERKNVAKAEAEGTISECECCCCDYPLNRMVHCDGETLHWFCRGCARRTAEVEIGKSKYELHCMSTDKCSAGFSLDQRVQFLDDNTRVALERNEQEANLRLAGIENLESCPFCPFAAEYPPVEIDREFRCQAPDCEKISCRLCKLESHTPKSCEENAKDSGLSIRRHIEEAMSAAMIRKCNKCGTPFIKEEGCNKMTCTRNGCFNIQCYVCSVSCDYNHFNDTSRGGKVGNCPLFESVEQRHDEEVKQAEKDALRKVLADHPEYSEEDLKVKMSDNVKKDDAKRKSTDPRAQIEALRLAIGGRLDYAANLAEFEIMLNRPRREDLYGEIGVDEDHEAQLEPRGNPAPRYPNMIANWQPAARRPMPAVGAPAPRDVEEMVEQWRAEIRDRRANGQPAPALLRIPRIDPEPKARVNQDAIAQAGDNFGFLGNFQEVPGPIAPPVNRPPLPVPDRPANPDENGNARSKLRHRLQGPARPENAEELRRQQEAEARVNQNLLREARQAVREARNAQEAENDNFADAWSVARERHQQRLEAYEADVMEVVAQDQPVVVPNPQPARPAPRAHESIRARLEDLRSAVQQQRRDRARNNLPGKAAQAWIPERADVRTPSPPPPNGDHLPVRPRKQPDQGKGYPIPNADQGPRPNAWVGINHNQGPEEILMRRYLNQVALANVPAILLAEQNLNPNANANLDHNAWVIKRNPKLALQQLAAGAENIFQKEPFPAMEMDDFPNLNQLPIPAGPDADRDKNRRALEERIAARKREVDAHVEAVAVHARAYDDRAMAMARDVARAQARGEFFAAEAQAAGRHPMLPPLPRQNPVDYMRRLAPQFYAGHNEVPGIAERREGGGGGGGGRAHPGLDEYWHQARRLRIGIGPGGRLAPPPPAVPFHRPGLGRYEMGDALPGMQGRNGHGPRYPRSNARYAPPAVHVPEEVEEEYESFGEEV